MEQPEQTHETSETLTSHGMTPQEEAELIAFYTDAYSDTPEPTESKESPVVDAERLKEEVSDLKLEMNRFQKNFPLEELREMAVLSPLMVTLLTKNFTKRHPDEPHAAHSEREKIEGARMEKNLLKSAPPEDLELYELRLGALAAIKPIQKKLSGLKGRLDDPEWQKLRAKYQILQQAIGAVREGRIVHDNIEASTPDPETADTIKIEEQAENDTAEKLANLREELEITK